MKSPWKLIDQVIKGKCSYSILQRLDHTSPVGVLPLTSVGVQNEVVLFLIEFG